MAAVVVMLVVGEDTNHGGKKLGDWGYDVDDTPPKPRAKKAVVPPAK